MTVGAARRGLSTPVPTVSRDCGFSEQIIRWQKSHGRHDLPWQTVRDPYRVWLSEVMLQQTQVSTVIPYFQRFLERFPDLATLASASVDEVLVYWSGLGYYARARHLHACAGRLMQDHGGRFPDDVATLASLPGIGRSTAGAIAALAFGRRAPILDGNVKRVLARCFGVDGPPAQSATLRTLWELAESLLPLREIEAYTQGLMDLGATVCRRSQPDCDSCPVAALCLARAQGLTGELPARRKARALPERLTALLLIDDGRRILLERRPPLGIWGGLMSLPEVGAGEGGEVLGWLAGAGLAVQGEPEMLDERRHAFTHFRLRMRPIRCRVAPRPFAGDSPLRWVAYGALASSALPAPVARLLAEVVVAR